MSDLRLMLDKFTDDIKQVTKIQPRQFDIVQVASVISSLPERKWNAAQARVDATIARKDAQQKLKALKASKMLAAKHDSTLKAAPDRTAWVDSQKDVQQAEIDVINADAEETAAELAFECLDDAFTAHKKIMDYLTDQEKATRDYNKFVDAGRRNG